jgi:hypothetical protein
LLLSADNLLTSSAKVPSISDGTSQLLDQIAVKCFHFGNSLFSLLRMMVQGISICGASTCHPSALPKVQCQFTDHVMKSHKYILPRLFSRIPP